MQTRKTKILNELESKDNLGQLNPEILHKTGCPVKDDMNTNTPLELTEQQFSKQQISQKI